MHISIVNFHYIHFQIILNISFICYTFNNTIHNSYLLKLQLVDICIMMYHHEHNIDDKFILMSFPDIIDDVHSLIYEQNDGDVKGISYVYDLVGYIWRSF